MECLLLSNKKKWTINAHNNMDEFQNNYADWKKPDRKEPYNLYFTPYKVLGSAN